MSKARKLGSLAVGIMSWVTPRDQKWQDFSQIDPEADQHQAQEIAPYLSKVLGEVSLQPKLQTKVYYRGSLPAQNQASSPASPGKRRRIRG